MPRIAFMGTPEFAAHILSALAEAYEVCVVYTRADKPAGRGKQLSESAVKTLAREKAIPVEQPGTLRGDQAQVRLMQYHPDLIVVAAYGLILPQAVLDIPRHGCVNVHASLLPRWRGPSPITAAILAGDTETGITLMQMDSGVDTGPVIAAREIEISQADTASTLSEKLSHLGAELLLETLAPWTKGNIAPMPQSGEATFSALVKKENGLIDWNRPALEIGRAVRAYNPWPSAHTLWNGSRLQIWRAQVSGVVRAELPGTVVQLGNDIGVNTAAGVLVLREVQLAGRRLMSVEEFVRGQRGFVGALLG